MATAPLSHPDTSTLDEIFLDLAALIELSPYDRRIAESRYRRLKEHVERPSSTLRPYLIDGESLIYAQPMKSSASTRQTDAAFFLHLRQPCVVGYVMPSLHFLSCG